MKLSDWARKQGISYRAAWNQYRNGTLDVPARQLPTGTIVMDVEDSPRKAVIYARVSSSDQKQDLDSQVARCLAYANKHNIPVAKSVTEVGSGMDGKRRKLLRLLSDPEITHIIVEHRDRPMRFGSEFVEASLSARGTKLIIVDEDELQDDLVEDMESVLTSFCARLYGRWLAKHRARRALEVSAE